MFQEKFVWRRKSLLGGSEVFRHQEDPWLIYFGIRTKSINRNKFDEQQPCFPLSKSVRCVCFLCWIKANPPWCTGANCRGRASRRWNSPQIEHARPWLPWFWWWCCWWNFNCNNTWNNYLSVSKSRPWPHAPLFNPLAFLLRKGPNLQMRMQRHRNRMMNLIQMKVQRSREKCSKMLSFLRLKTWARCLVLAPKWVNAYRNGSMVWKKFPRSLLRRKLLSETFPNLNNLCCQTQYFLLCFALVSCRLPLYLEDHISDLSVVYIYIYIVDDTVYIIVCFKIFTIIHVYIIYINNDILCYLLFNCDLFYI